MRTELRCVPYVEVFGVLRVALICSLLVVYEYDWGCSIGYGGFWNSYDAVTCGAAFACYGERHCC